MDHVLANQCLRQKKPKTFRVEFTGKKQPGVAAKDLSLKLIGMIGTAGATGHVIEYGGPAIRAPFGRIRDYPSRARSEPGEAEARRGTRRPKGPDAGS